MELIEIRSYEVETPNAMQKFCSCLEEWSESLSKEVTVLNAGSWFLCQRQGRFYQGGTSLWYVKDCQWGCLWEIEIITEYQNESRILLIKILKEKAREVAAMRRGSPTLRETYRLYGLPKESSRKASGHYERPARRLRYSCRWISSQAKTYEENGAVMIVLTDEVFFKGSIEYLQDLGHTYPHPQQRFNRWKAISGR